jgi:hypothetical protein
LAGLNFTEEQGKELDIISTFNIMNICGQKGAEMMFFVASNPSAFTPKTLLTKILWRGKSKPRESKCGQISEKKRPAKKQTAAKKSLAEEDKSN